MATGMGPSSSGSQATVASVVTSSLLAGLGVGGGVISSLPSSVWPTHAPQATHNPTRPSAVPEKSSTEQAAPQGSETESLSEENQPAREDGEEEEEGEREGEQEEGEEHKKRKNKTPDNEEKQGNNTVAKEPLVPTPASTAKEKGEGKPTVKGTTTPASTGDEQLVNVEKNPTDVNAVSTQEPGNDSAEMQIPHSSTLSPDKERNKKKGWPFSVHTGEQSSFFHAEETHFLSVYIPSKQKNPFLTLHKPCSLVIRYHTSQDFSPKQNSAHTTNSYGAQFNITNKLI